MPQKNLKFLSKGTNIYVSQRNFVHFGLGSLQAGQLLDLLTFAAMRWKKKGPGINPALF